jgi:hypothetical protein
LGKLVKLAILLSVVAIGGCASIVDDRDQNIAIMTTPDQADFVIKNENGLVVHRGVTPSTVNLPKSGGYFDGNDYSIEISKAGYESRRANIEAEPSLWYLLGNLGFGGPIGWLIVDPLTGAMWDLKPDKLDLGLGRGQAAVPRRQPAPAPAPVGEPAAAARFGALVASFENEDQAELGKTEIWNRHPQVLGNVRPSITYGSVADAKPRYLVIGGGLTNDEAIGVCASLAQRNEPCTVIQFQT